MTRRFTIITALVMVLAVLLSGCDGGSGNGENGGGTPSATSTGGTASGGNTAASGAYTEKRTSVTGYSEAYGPVIAPDGSINIIARNGSDASLQLNTYASADAEPAILKLDVTGTINGFSFTPSGQLVIMATDYSSIIPRMDTDSAQAGGEPVINADNEPPSGEAAGDEPPAEPTENDSNSTPAAEGDIQEGGASNSAGTPILRSEQGEGPETEAPAGGAPQNNAEQGREGGRGEGGFEMRQMNMPTAQLFWMNEHGGIDYTLALSNTQNNMISNNAAAFAALDNGEFLIAGQNCVERYDDGGGLISAFGNASAFTYANGIAYVIESGKVVSYDAETAARKAEFPYETETDATPAPDSSGMGGGFYARDSSRRVFIAGEDIYLLDTSTSRMLKLTGDNAPLAVMDTLKYAIGDPTMTVNGYAMTEDGGLLALAGTGTSGFFVSGGGEAMQVGSFMSSDMETTMELCAYTWDPSIDMSQIWFSASQRSGTASACARPSASSTRATPTPL